jgi:hypothetical protein
MRVLAFALVITLSASAGAEDWSRYIDHGDDTASMKTSQPRASASQPRAAKTAAKAPAAKPAKARASKKAPRK